MGEQCWKTGNWRMHTNTQGSCFPKQHSYCWQLWQVPKGSAIVGRKDWIHRDPCRTLQHPQPGPNSCCAAGQQCHPWALLLLSHSFLWIRSIKIPNVTLPSQEQAVLNQLSALQREKNRNTKVQRTALFYMAGFFNPEEQFRKMEVFLKIASLLCSMLKKKSKPGENGKYKNKYAFMMILQPHTK